MVSQPRYSLLVEGSHQLVAVMVTVSVEVVSGFVSISWRLGSGGEADGLQKDSVSMQQY
jgi:hypothetical protein